MPQEVTDQLGETISLQAPAKRIVSLVPSQTELLYALGLDQEVVGLTKFCVHPERWYREKSRVGGTKNVNVAKVKALSPDLIIANKEENTEKDILQLTKEFPVWVSDIRSLDDALEMIEHIGDLTDTRAKAIALTAKIRAEFDDLKQFINGMPKLKVLYLIWKDPIMAAGTDTFIHAMLEMAGFENVIESDDHRYPSLSPEEIRALEPDLLLLSSEPFPFKEKHAEEMQATFPDIKTINVDGEIFSWYGSHLLKSAAYFKQLRLDIQSTQ